MRIRIVKNNTAAKFGKKIGRPLTWFVLILLKNLLEVFVVFFLLLFLMLVNSGCF